MTVMTQRDRISVAENLARFVIFSPPQARARAILVASSIFS
jgi:hypothetical protein